MTAFQKLSMEHLNKLRMFGFVHVTGLTAYKDQGSARSESAPIQGSYQDAGKWNANNGMIVMVFPDCQVWLGRCVQTTWKDLRVFMEQELGLRVDENKSTFVPCSNGESIHSSELFFRIADPYEDSMMNANRMFSRA